MATYSSKPVTVNHPIEEIYSKVSNLGAFQQRLETLPQEAKEKLGDVRFTNDSIIINAPAVGEIKFNVVERVSPSLVRLSAENSPVPFGIAIKLAEAAAGATTVGAYIDVEIPMMLKPLIGGKMQEAADKFGEMFATFFGS